MHIARIPVPVGTVMFEESVVGGSIDYRFGVRFARMGELNIRFAGEPNDDRSRRVVVLYSPENVKLEFAEGTVLTGALLNTAGQLALKFLAAHRAATFADELERRASNFLLGMSGALEVGAAQLVEVSPLSSAAEALLAQLGAFRAQIQQTRLETPKLLRSISRELSALGVQVLAAGTSAAWPIVQFSELQ